MPTSAPPPPVTHDDLRATVAAHAELGDGYEDGLAGTLLERLDAQLQQRHSGPPSAARGDAVTAAIALGSITLGVVFGLVAFRLGHLGGTVATIVVWIAIALINVVHARSRAR